MSASVAVATSQGCAGPGLRQASLSNSRCACTWDTVVEADPAWEPRPRVV